MDVITHYKGYIIQAFELEPSHWRANIQKIDGSDITIVLPTNHGKPTYTSPSIMTSAPRFTADAAIEFAKEAIDGDGMR
jgi:hypothetical protein